MPDCWIFLLKRRSALSKVSFSPTRISANAGITSSALGSSGSRHRRASVGARVLGGARERGLRARRSVVLTRRRWQTPADLHDAGRIEPVRGLIRDRELRLAKESERECQALAHPGRETAHAAPADIGKPNPGQQDGASDPQGSLRQPGRHAEDQEVLGRGEVWVERGPFDQRPDAGDDRGSRTRWLAQEARLARGRPEEAEQQPDRGRLARAVRAKEAEDAAGGHREVDGVHGPDRPEGPRETARLDRRFQSAPLPKARWRRCLLYTSPSPR